MHSEQATTTEQIRELFLLEQFTNGVDRESGEVIREKRIKVTREAAIWADDHALAKRGSQFRGGSYSYPSRVGDYAARRERKDTGVTGRTSPVSSGMSRGPAVSGRTSPVVGGMAKAQGAGERKVPPRAVPLKCFFCGGAGHIKPHCAKYKASLEAKPVSLVMGGERKSEGDGRRGVAGCRARKVECG